QRRAGRLDRARAGDRAHERRRHRAARAASERGAPFLRLHALARGAAAPAVARLRADPRQPALAARPAPLPADRPRARHGRARQMAEVIRGRDRQAQRAMKIGTVPIFLIALLALQTHAQTLPELALYAGPERAQRLVEGAQKEGTLLFYTTFPPEYANQLIEPFERRYGIKVNYWRTRSEIILSRALAEGRAGSATADVITTISPQLEVLRREGLLQKVRSPYQQQHADFAIPAHREWVATLQHVFVHAYNTDKVRPAELPHKFQDLLAPKWKGRLAIEGDDHEWLSSVIADMGEAEGIKFWRELVATNGISVRSGHPLLTSLVASGEIPLALTVYQYSVEQAKKKGSPIDWFVIEPAVSITNGIAVPKKAAHPHAALLFYDHIIGIEGQRILAKIGYVPTHRQVESPAKGVRLKLLDASTLLDEQEKSRRLYERLILKGAAR